MRLNDYVQLRIIKQNALYILSSILSFFNIHSLSLAPRFWYCFSKNYVRLNCNQKNEKLCVLL